MLALCHAKSSSPFFDNFSAFDLNSAWVVAGLDGISMSFFI
jgi:hypothetical protein